MRKREGKVRGTRMALHKKAKAVRQGQRKIQHASQAPEAHIRAELIEAGQKQKKPTLPVESTLDYAAAVATGPPNVSDIVALALKEQEAET